MDIQRIQQALENQKRCLARFMGECQTGMDQITEELAHLKARAAMLEQEEREEPRGTAGELDIMDIAASRPAETENESHSHN